MAGALFLIGSEYVANGISIIQNIIGNEFLTCLTIGTFSHFFNGYILSCRLLFCDIIRDILDVVIIVTDRSIFAAVILFALDFREGMQQTDIVSYLVGNSSHNIFRINGLFVLPLINSLVVDADAKWCGEISIFVGSICINKIFQRISCRNDGQCGESEGGCIATGLSKAEYKNVDVLLQILYIFSIVFIFQELVGVIFLEVNFLTDDAWLLQFLALVVILSHLEDDMHVIGSIEFVDGIKDFGKLALVGILFLVRLVMVHHMENYWQMIVISIEIACKGGLRHGNFLFLATQLNCDLTGTGLVGDVRAYPQDDFVAVATRLEGVAPVLTVIVALGTPTHTAAQLDFVRSNTGAKG